MRGDPPRRDNAEVREAEVLDQGTVEDLVLPGERLPHVGDKADDVDAGERVTHDHIAAADVLDDAVIGVANSDAAVI